MSKPRWILTADVDNPRTGKRGDSCIVYDQADLDKRVQAAKDAGVDVDVRDFPEDWR